MKILRIDCSEVRAFRSVSLPPDILQRHIVFSHVYTYRNKYKGMFIEYESREEPFAQEDRILEAATGNYEDWVGFEYIQQVSATSLGTESKRRAASRGTSRWAEAQLPGQ